MLDIKIAGQILGKANITKILCVGMKEAVSCRTSFYWTKKSIEVHYNTDKGEPRSHWFSEDQFKTATLKSNKIVFKDGCEILLYALIPLYPSEDGRVSKTADKQLPKQSKRSKVLPNKPKRKQPQS